MEFFGGEHGDREPATARSRFVRIVEYDGTGSAISRDPGGASDGIDPALEMSAQGEDDQDWVSARAPGELDGLSTIDLAVDDALVHAPRRNGAPYPEVVRRICERIEVSEETAWAIVGRALARTDESGAG